MIPSSARMMMANNKMTYDHTVPAEKFEIKTWLVGYKRLT